LRREFDFFFYIHRCRARHLHPDAGWAGHNNTKYCRFHNPDADRAIEHFGWVKFRGAFRGKEHL